MKAGTQQYHLCLCDLQFITCGWIIGFTNIGVNLAEFQSDVYIEWPNEPCIGQSGVKGHLWFLCEHTRTNTNMFLNLNWIEQIVDECAINIKTPLFFPFLFFFLFTCVCIFQLANPGLDVVKFTLTAAQSGLHVCSGSDRELQNREAP